MAKRMLIDSTHPEETRVVLVNGNRLEEFDFESARKKQIKGNVYLAKVTRVEPSLQACFVEYGGNRHGFLAFNEIHPDYYRIPVADREALNKIMADAVAAEDDEDEQEAEPKPQERERPRGRRRRRWGRRGDKNGNGDRNADGAPAQDGDEPRAAIGSGDSQERHGDTGGAPPSQFGDSDAPMREPSHGDEPAALDMLHGERTFGVTVESAAPDAEAAPRPDPFRAEAAADTRDADRRPDPFGSSDAADGDRATSFPGSEPVSDAAARAGDREDSGFEPAGDVHPDDKRHDEDHRDDGQHEERHHDDQHRDDQHREDRHREDQRPDDNPRDDDRRGDERRGGQNGDGERANAGEVAGLSEASFDAPRNGDTEVRPPEETVETVGGDEVEDIRHRNRHWQRRYKIQEVIRKRQILLVQVNKEERGNKGAALTTYISLAGRYCVLMPNTPRGGGISRKITSHSDRKRLKEIIGEMEVPDGMAVIVRTAGMERNKDELRRDLNFLLKTWEGIREKALSSTAPALIYEEASLIKRAVRDLYASDVEEIVVDGEEGYDAARTFMKLLMPGHEKKVVQYSDKQIPLYHRYQVESQIDNMHSPTVQLRSGGYIVLSPTEALVAIDVNSGRSTRERNIEETAYRTNVEAAEEVARQLRLRDLAGLIVIDFIDMEDGRNRHTVERRLKDALKQDRARIQVGRISPFGLLEMSRQRLRPSLVEASMMQCPHCGGAGHVRSTESMALTVLRAVEEEGMRQRSAEITVSLPTTVTLYIFNHKRAALLEIESRHGFHTVLQPDDTRPLSSFEISRTVPKSAETKPLADARSGDGDDADEAPQGERLPGHDRAEAREPAPERDAAPSETERAPPREGRRHDGRRHRGEDRAQERAQERAPEPEAAPVEAVAEAGDEGRGDAAVAGEQPGGEDGQGERRGRRRGRRGGRRRRGRQRDENGNEIPGDEGDAPPPPESTLGPFNGSGESPSDEPVSAPIHDTAGRDADAARRHDESGRDDIEAPTPVVPASVAPAPVAPAPVWNEPALAGSVTAEVAPEPAASSREPEAVSVADPGPPPAETAPTLAAPEPAAAQTEPVPAAPPEPAEPPKPPKRGWWNLRRG